MIPERRAAAVLELLRLYHIFYTDTTVGFHLAELRELVVSFMFTRSVGEISTQ